VRALCAAFPSRFPLLPVLTCSLRAASVFLTSLPPRARRADPLFTLDGHAGPAVARLVARLDGMPLAIELAAARVEALGVAGLLDRLDDRFALLTEGGPGRGGPAKVAGGHGGMELLAAG
jgi:predicted ATPase